MKHILKRTAAVMAAVILTVTWTAPVEMVLAENLSDTENSVFAETECIDFEGENSYTSENGSAKINPRKNKKGETGLDVVKDPADSSNNVGLLKALYQTNDDGSYKQDSNGKYENLTSANLNFGGIEKGSAHRVSWRMKYAGQKAATHFHLWSNTEGKTKYLSKMGIDENAKVVTPKTNRYNGDNTLNVAETISEDLNGKKFTNPDVSLNNNVWHTFEAFLYSAGKGNDTRKIVELYIDGKMYATYERTFDINLSLIEIYSSASTASNIAAAYIDDIRISKIPDKFYITTDYNSDKNYIDLVYSLYPKYQSGTSAQDITIDNDVQITSRQVNGRFVRLNLNHTLTAGKKYTLTLPSGITSGEQNLSGNTVVYEVPPEQPGEITVSCDQTGRIFTDNDINDGKLKFDVTIKNTSSETLNFKLNGKIVAEDGTVIKMINNSIYNLNANSDTSRGFTFKKSDFSDLSRQYGRFYFVAESRPGSMETFKTVKKMFTVVYSNGAVNEKVGTSSHYTRGSIGDKKENDAYGIFDYDFNSSKGRWECSTLKEDNLKSILNLHKVAGFGLIRDDVLSRTTYRGQVQKDRRNEILFEETKNAEMNMIQLVDLGIWSKDGTYYQSGIKDIEGFSPMPIKEDLENFKEKTKEFTELDKQSHLYELFNEYNLGDAYRYKDTNDTSKMYDLYKWENSQNVLKLKDYRYSMTDYVNAVQAASEGIRSADPQAHIMGISSAKDNMVKFFEECFSAGIGKYIDSVSIHPYSVDYAPELGHKDDGMAESTRTPLRKRIQEVREVMDKHGYPDMPIYITELGWATGALTPITEEVQAQYTIRALGLSDDLVAGSTFYEAQEHPTTSADSREACYGMLYTNDNGENALGAKPVYTALCCYNSLVGDKTRQNGVTTDAVGNMYCTYENSAEKVIMYWNPNKDNSEIGITDSDNNASAYIRDMYGNIVSQNVSASGNVYNLTADKNPKYLVINKDAEKGLCLTNAYIKADGLRIDEDFASKFDSLSDVRNVRFELKTSFKNNSDSQCGVTAVAAVYGSDGRLKEVSVKTYKVSPGEALMPRDIPTVIADVTDTVKGFVWDTQTQIPLCKSIGV